MKARRQLLVASLVLLAPTAPSAQSVGRVRRIGILGNVAPPTNAGNPIQVFIEALGGLGWIEAKTIAFDYRWAEQRYDRFPALARELVELGVDLIMVTAGVTAALAAKQATTTIPILAVAVADPVKFGLVASFSHPGGNVTGIVQPLVDWGKWLELAHDAIAGVARIAVIGNPTNVVYADYVAQNEAAARQLGLKLQMIPVARVDELASAFQAMKAAHADALVIGTDSLYFNNLKEILERAAESRLPVITPFRPAAEMGALLAWGFDIRYAFRRAAAYADRILRGARPADLPMEQPERFELVINLRTAKTLGLTIPRSVLLRADVLGKGRVRPSPLQSAYIPRTTGDRDVQFPPCTVGWSRLRMCGCSRVGCRSPQLEQCAGRADGDSFVPVDDVDGSGLPERPQGGQASHRGGGATLAPLGN